MSDISERNYLIVAVLASVVSAFLGYYALALGLLIVLGYFFYTKISTEIIITFSYLILLLLTSDLGEMFRNLANLFVIVLLSAIFLYKKGFVIKEYAQVRESIVYFFFFTLFAIIISTLLSRDPLESSEYLFKYLVFFFIVYIVYNFTTDRKTIRNRVLTLSIPGLVISLGVIFTFIISPNALVLFITQGQVYEGGYFNNVAAAGGLITISLLTTIGMLYYSGFDNRVKIILKIMILFQLTGLILTNSRAAILAFIVGLVFILWHFSRKKLLIFLSAFMILLIIIFVVYPTTFDYLGLYFRVGRIFENARYNLWQIAFEVIRDNPFFGVGPGQFKHYMYKYIPVMLGSWEELDIIYISSQVNVGNAHNLLLFLFSELGIAGVIIVGAMIGIFFRLGFRAMRSSDQEYRIIAIIITGAGLGLFVRSMFESTGFMTYGWITRDLPFWTFVLVLARINDLLPLGNGQNEMT